MKKVMKGDPATNERLARLERAGLVRRSKRPLDLKALRKGAPKSKRSVTQALIEERSEAARKRLKGALKRYVEPLEPVLKPEEWDVNK